MGSNLIGHLHPDFIKTVEEVKDMLRTAWGTKNKLTFPISGTGSAGMETCVANLVDKGDKVLVLTNGYFGIRFTDMCTRHGGDVVKDEAASIDWGTTFSKEVVQKLVTDHKPVIVMVVNAETSTGCL